MTKKKVEVRRRRRVEPAPGGERERAEAPRRDRPPSSGGTTRPPSQPAGPAPQIPIGGLLQALGGGRMSLPMMLGLVGILAICACLYLFVLAPSGPDEDLPLLVEQAPPTAISQPVVPAGPTRTPRPFTPPAVSSPDGQTWLVMLYQDADDKVLEHDIYVDLNEAERAGSTERMHVVAQVDRYRAGFRGDGDWSTTKRFYVTLDQDLNSVYSQEIADLGEVNMADGDTLVDFVTWSIDNFPADKHVLILSDHGMGWPGGWTDPDPGGRGADNVPLADMGDQLFLMEMDAALQEIRERTGLDQFELIGLDACLMGHLEVLDVLAAHARYAVASQETEPALGWAYTGFLGALSARPDMDGAELAQIIVHSYIEEDQRIVDDQARVELLSRGSPLAGLLGVPSARQVAQQMQDSVTLAAIDLQAVPELVARVNELAYALQGARQKDVARARSYAQSFTSVFGQQVPPSYLDLGHLAQLLQTETGNQEVSGAAGQVLAALGQAVIAEKHGPKKPAASGVSIYFPNSDLYRSRYGGPESYTTVAERFAVDSLWDDFLTYHYTGRPFELGAGVVSVPERSATVAGPGAGVVGVSPVRLSAASVAPGETIRLSADISGDSVGYVLLFVGYFDQQSNSIFVADTDYLESDQTRQIDGVYYPEWGQDAEFTMEFEWEPVVFAINDGRQSVVTHFTPAVYGASAEEAVYTVEGEYVYRDGGESRHALLYFSDGALTQVFGFTGEGGTGAPREIIPNPGDTFTVWDEWLDLDPRGRVTETVMLPGGTLTFGDQPFTWEALDAAAGEYIAGFIVEDLDGNAYESFAVVTVE